MIEVDAATVLVQWAAGGWVFLWVTTRLRIVGLGYGWIQRTVFLALAVGSLVAAFATEVVFTRDIVTVAFMVVGGLALAMSVARKSAGVAGQRDDKERRRSRVADMVRPHQSYDQAPRASSLETKEFPPALDLVAASVGMIAVLLAAVNAGDPVALSLARGLTSAAFLGVVTNAMLLGHWYLVQPGLSREPLAELVRWLGVIWVPETLLFLWPVGMISVLNGTIDDGYNGLLGWFWVACVASTIILAGIAYASLKERAYSAVMAATGLLYLAILTAFGQDLVARILLSA